MAPWVLGLVTDVVNFIGQRVAASSSHKDSVVHLAGRGALEGFRLAAVIAVHDRAYLQAFYDEIPDDIKHAILLKVEDLVLRYPVGGSDVSHSA